MLVINSVATKSDSISYKKHTFVLSEDIVSCDELLSRRGVKEIRSSSQGSAVTKRHMDGLVLCEDVSQLKDRLMEHIIRKRIYKVLY